jgi:hypothetical protein
MAPRKTPTTKAQETDEKGAEAVSDDQDAPKATDATEAPEKGAEAEEKKDKGGDDTTAPGNVAGPFDPELIHLPGHAATQAAWAESDEGKKFIKEAEDRESKAAEKDDDKG